LQIVEDILPMYPAREFALVSLFKVCKERKFALIVLQQAYP
jgi:hypothetical protein